MDFPLHAFLERLRSDDIKPTLRDYDRLSRAFGTGGMWTVPRLRNTLTALLAKDEDQQRLIRRRFDGFFKPETGLERRLVEIDVRQVFRELGDLPPKPEPPIPHPKPPPKQEIAFEVVKPEEPGEEDAYSGNGPPVRWWWIALLILVVVVGGFAVYIQNRPTPPPPGPAIQSGPICSLRPTELHFGTLPLNEQRNISFILANAGDKDLIIKHMALSPEQGPFEVALPAAPPALRPGEETRLVATFTPQTQGAFSAEIRIDHNAENGTAKVSLDGKGATFGRAVKRVPYVHDVQVETIPLPPYWHFRIALTAVLFFVFLLWVLYIWRLKVGPFVKKPKVDEKGPKFFHRGLIGGKPERRLDEASLGLLADAMGYFNSERPGKMLDVPASVRATVRRGGIPSCVFFTRKQIRTLLVLEDADAEALDWNPISRELAEGIARCGVPVQYGRFRGTPERFRSLDGQVHYLEDLEDRRKGILLLIFTDGKGFQRPRNAFALESVARWPMKAWMDLRDQRLWDDTIRLAVKHGIPVHPATREGLFQAVGRFLTERGTADRVSGNAATETWLPGWEAGREDVWLEHFLGDALPWAQDCAVMQPMPDGLADSLRRRFHGMLPPEAVERLYALPNTTRTEAGFWFAGDVQAALRKGFLQRRSDEDQRAVVRFVLDRIEAARPKAPEDSLAYLSWEAIWLRVRVELGRPDDLKRFGALLRTPLAGFLGDSLSDFRLPDRGEKIPLLRVPEGRRGLRWLGKAPGDPLKIGSFLSWRHWAVFGAVAVLFFAFAGWTLDGALRPVRNWEVKVLEPGLAENAAVLEKWENDDWRVERRGAVGSIDATALQADQKYRLILQDDSSREERVFRVDQGKKAIVFLAGKDIEVATAVSGRPLCDTAGEEWTEPHTGMTFVCVPGGEFKMGCGGEWAGECDSDEKPAHSVRLSGFWLGKYEVTVGEFQQFASETKHDNAGCKNAIGDQHPVACVSWNEATSFAEWLSKKNDVDIGFRLPTEAEWEYACRNRGENLLYCGGNDIESVAWYTGNSGYKTHEVGGKKHNGIGIYDMSGNVWEWCQDWHGDYASGQVQDPTGPNSGAFRVLRGGSWVNAAGDCRSSIRNGNGPGYRSANRGFRLAFPAGQ